MRPEPPVVLHVDRMDGTVQEESKTRTLLLVSGFIHDASLFLDHHPGGKPLLGRSSGKDMTAAFFGGIYSHSHAAHNVRDYLIQCLVVSLMMFRSTPACFLDINTLSS